MENFEKIFNQFLDCVQTLQAALNVSFTEALVETFDNLEQGKIKVENGAPDEKTVAQLSKKNIRHLIMIKLVKRIRSKFLLS